MIFATVGTQLAFPRLISSLVALAPRLDEDIVVQAGQRANPDWHIPRLSLHETLTPAEFEKHFTAARLVVAHAGIGTILSARQWNKPLVIMPRRHGLGEHRNDHQLATARQVERLPGIYIAWNESDLAELLARQDLAGPVARGEMGPFHSLLVERLQQFIST